MTNFVGDYFDRTLFQGISEGIDTAGVTTSLEGTPADGTFANLSGEQGPDGPQGEAGTPFVWQGDIADRAALDALIPTLRPAMAGYAFRLESDNSVMFWTGTNFISFVDAFGGHGLTGQNNTLTIGTVTTGAVGSALIVSITGTPPSQTLNLTVPRGGTGQKGLTGPPGPIRNSTDYDNTITHTNGMVPLWDESAAKWVPTEWPGFRGPWSVLENQSWDNPSTGFSADQTNISTATNTIATINIPALPIRWRPYIIGGAVLKAEPTDFTTRVDLEVRIGSNAGEIVARGVGSAVSQEWYVRLRPYFSATITPDSTTGTIAPSTATTLYVVIKKNLGSGNYSYKRAGAEILVWAHPNVGP